MASPLNDPSLLHDHDAVSIADGGKPVGDDEGGSSLHQSVHPGLDQPLRPGINGRGGLVQNQHRRVRHCGPGNSQQLPALRPQLHIVPFESLFGMVENRQLHIAFGLASDSKKTVLSYRELFSCPVVCICAPDHPLASSGPLTRDLLRGALITSPPHRISEAVLGIHAQISASLSYRGRYFCENIEGILTLVKAGLGYTLYPDIPRMREAGLRYIPVADLPALSFGVYYRPDNDHPALRRFLRLLLDQSRSHA